ncbi:TolC family protein [Ascidiimonas aurantiaca]|uniref:TolC family protein n=1 Tax=Ascidiimonas aurantiaca TaxID=1685432 RepID=UPI0030EE9CB6
MLYKQIICTYAILWCCIAFSQNTTSQSYSLSDCIIIAIENNLDLRSAVLTSTSAKVNYQQSKANLLPTLNGDFDLGINDGRSIDPFTNDFINQKLTFSSARLRLDATIFNGFRLLNTAKQNRFNKMAAEMEIEEARQNLVLNVTLAYLQVLNSRDVLRLNKRRLEATLKQLKIQENLYKNESGNPADYADILGQKTIDETNILTSESSLNNAKLELRQLLNLDQAVDLNTEDLVLDFEKYELSSEEVYKDALQNLATFKARELRVKAAEKGVSVAKSQFTPEISVFGRVNTNYSSAAEVFTETGTSIVETDNFVTINNEVIPVFEERTDFRAESISFTDQFDNNLNTVIGVAVNIPLFNGFRAKNNVALEKIRVKESLVALERTHQEIKNAISRVHFDMEAAYGRYKSIEKQVEAFGESYRINEILFNEGVSNFLAYITSKNNLDNAQINLANVKYEYLLRVKVLEYYRGLSF